MEDNILTHKLLMCNPLERYFYKCELYHVNCIDYLLIESRFVPSPSPILLTSTDVRTSICNSVFVELEIQKSLCNNKHISCELFINTKMNEYEEKFPIIVDGDESEEDWYNESDTADDVPDEINNKSSLYQEKDKLPVPLLVGHFEVGLLYSMTLHEEKEHTMLVMIIQTTETSFLCRVFYVRGSTRKTYHQGAKDKLFRYSDIWRLAPRWELVRKRTPNDVYIGQTIRFINGMEKTYTTGIVLSHTSRTLKCLIMCGEREGQTCVFEKSEMVECTEIFGSTILQNIMKQVKNAS